MRIEIDGRWEPRDFVETLKAVESLYYLAVSDRDWPPLDYDEYRYLRARRSPWTSFDDFLDQSNRWMLEHAHRLVPADRRIYVTKIDFASPGGIDFAGIGQAVEAIGNTVGKLVSYYGDRRLRKERDEQAAIETEMKEQHLASLKIDNARKLLELRRDFPDDEHLIALAVRDQDKLADRIAQGLITGAKSESGK